MLKTLAIVSTKRHWPNGLSVNGQSAVDERGFAAGRQFLIWQIHGCDKEKEA